MNTNYTALLFLKSFTSIARKVVLGGAIVISLLIGTMNTNAEADIRENTLKALSEHYSSVPTMKGEFLQFGPKGEQSGGTFYIQRPGKVRFDYDDPSPIEVVSNGLAVMVINNKLKTFDSYPLKKTPLKLLLDDKLNISNKSIIEVKNEPDVTTVIMGDKQIFGNSVITLLFEPDTFDLRQWTIKDSQGKETSVMVFNVSNEVEIPSRTFQINKSKFKRKN